MKALFKRLKSDGHFRDFFHRASSLKNDKRIRARMDRRKLKRKEGDENEAD